MAAPGATLIDGGLASIDPKKLVRDEVVEARVLGLLHHGHSATAQFLDDAVVRDGLADHLR
jgi:hypothetical protein